MSVKGKRYNKTATKHIISALRHIAFAHDFLNYGVLKVDFLAEVAQLGSMLRKIDDTSVGEIEAPMSKNIEQMAKVVGALQDTLRINSDAIGRMAAQQYGVIASLDLIFMELVSILPEDQRKGILQNQFDESQSGAQNDLVALVRIRDYFSRRISDCEKFIAEKGVKSE